MSPHRTALHVITGATGSGKTTVIRALIAQRPATERWAVLTNDFAPATLGGAPPRLMQNVTVREVAGCACCTGQLVMRTALVALLREPRPDRVVIEASSAAEPKALFSLFEEPALASVVDMRPVVATAAVSHLVDARYVTAAVYGEQLKSADVIVLTAPPAVTDEQLADAKVALARFVSAHARLLQDLRELKLEMLDRSKPPSSRPSP